MKTIISRKTLINLFAGNATPIERKMIEEWLSEPGNVEQYYEWLEEWERERIQFQADVDNASKRFLHRIHPQHQITITSGKEKKSTTSTGWRLLLAACISMVLMVTAYFYQDLVMVKTYTTHYNELSSITLPDGSTVLLNANSSLSHARFSFGKHDRNVYLTGEAEFSVVHTHDDKKFIVTTPDQLEVEVLGTEFIVYARDLKSKVVLSSGSILLRSNLDSSATTLLVKPGDVVTIDKGAFSIQENQRTEVHNAWKEHRFVFDKTSLEEIALKMEERFGLKLHITDSVLARRELTGTYEAQNAKELLDVLSKLLDLDFHRNGRSINVYPRDN